jgi:peroxiredoxin
VKALEEYLYAFPDEIEAKAFLVLQIWDNQQHDVPLPSRLAVDALAQQVLAKAPMHPGIHHYLIHLWNHKDGDKRAVLSAERCGLGAPGIAHLWHMSGHTYSELKKYPEAVWRQEASARTDHAYMAASRVMPEQIHNYAHNNDWLVQNLCYVGRIHDAMELAKNLIELPRLGPGKQQAWRMGRDRLLSTALDFEQWDAITALESTAFLSPDEDAQRELVRERTLCVAWFSKGDSERGQQKLNSLKAKLASARAERLAAADKAEVDAKVANKPDDQIAKAMADAMRTFSGRIKELEQSIAELRLTRALMAGDLDAVRTQLPLAKGIASARLARIRSALGEHDTAEKLARDLIKADSAQVLGHAILVDVLWRANKKEAALEAFRALRERSGYLDLDVPAFARLAPVAAELKLPTDWRTPAAAVPSELPQLAQLGPFRWQPYEAPSFSLQREDHSSISLSEYTGKPVLVVFYLGAGCSRCIEQLNAFAPMAQDYKAAGIEIVAIGTDTPDGLLKTFALAKDAKGFPFPILSDHETNAFKAYRAYDDFEHQPLHGAFLVDGGGKVRWQNISYQPFTDVKWLLEESRRLLAIPSGPVSVTAAVK